MFRFWLMLIPALFRGAVAVAQYGTGIQSLMGNKRGDVATRCPRLYAGFGTGLNSPVGVAGAQIDIPVSQQVSMVPGFGFGT